MAYTVLYFASVRDRLGLERELVDAPANIDSVAFLKHLARLRPQAADLFATCRVAVNYEFIAAPMSLPNDAEIAVIPPVSGG